MNRRVAGLVTALVLMLPAFILVGVGRPADASTSAGTLPCRIYFGDIGVGASPSTYDDTFTLETSPAAAAVGDAVTVTFSATTGPRGGPVPLAANSFAVNVTLALSGAQSGTLSFDNGVNDYPAAAAGAFTFLGPYSVSTSFTPTASGTLGFALQQLKIDDGKYGGGSGANADTYCSGAPGDRDHKAAAEASTSITTELPVDAGTCTNTPTAITDELRTITVDGQMRSYYLSTPTTPPATDTALPIVFNLHGTGGNGLGGQISFMRAQGPARGYVVVSPNATIRPGTSTTGWAKLGESTPNEVAFLEAILADIRDAACIDDDRIYSTGHSNGAIFSVDLACRWIRVAAIAPFSGVSSTNPARCSERPVPLLTTHGTADEFTVYDGPSRPDPDLPDAANYIGDVPTDVDFWAFTTNQCDAGSRTVTTISPTVERTTYTGCAGATELYTVIGGGHVAFSASRTPPDPIDSAALALDFFDANSRIDGPAYVPPPPPAVSLPPLFATVAPTLTITPEGPYGDGDTVTITGSGFSEFRAVAVSICKRDKPILGPGSCMFVDRSRLVNSDADGSFTTTLDVMVGTINNSGDVCGPEDPCVFTGIALQRSCEIAQVPVAFAGGAAPAPLAPGPGCPRLLLAREEAQPGDQVEIRGVAFPPNEDVQLATYFQWPAEGEPSSDIIEVMTEADGTFSTVIAAPDASTGIGAFDGPPGASSFLYTAARFLSPADILTNPPNSGTPTPTPTSTPTPTTVPPPTEPPLTATPPPTVVVDPTPTMLSATPTSTTTTTGGTSGGALPQTGAPGPVPALVGVAALVLGALLVVRGRSRLPGSRT